MTENDPNRALVDRFLKAHQRRRAERAPYEGRWERIQRMLRPLREEIQQGLNAATPRGVANYDSAGPVSLDDAGSAIYSMLTSTDNIWAPVEHASPALRADPAARGWLRHTNEVLFGTLDPALSAFYTEAPETILDCLAIGPGFFYSAREPGAARFVDMSLPVSECYAEFDAYGALAAFDRRYQLSRAALLDQFPTLKTDAEFVAKTEKNPGDMLDVVHGVFRRGYGRMGEGWRWPVASIYVLEQGKKLLRSGGYEEMPYFAPQWSRSSREKYGRGRGDLALPDAEILSEQGRTGLIQDQRLSEPPLGTHDEIGRLVDLSPNAVNPGALDDRGNQLIQPLMLTSPQAAAHRLQSQEQRREAIRMAFYHALLSLVGSPTPSVVEILKRDERRDQSMGPNLARMMQQFLAPFITRRWNMLYRAGQFDPPPPQARGAAMRVRFVSPLAKAHKSQKANATMNVVMAAAQVAAVDPTARFALNGDAALRHIADGMAAPDDVLRSPTEAARLAQESQQAEALAFAAQNAAIGAQAVDSLSRAEAAQRGR